MKFVVLSRAGIESFEPLNVMHIIISVSTPNYYYGPEKLPKNGFTLGILRLSFHERYDIEAIDEASVKYCEKSKKLIEAKEAFSEETAKTVLDFVRNYKDKEIETIIIHCDAGLARSPAMAAGLANTMFKNEENVFYARRYMEDGLCVFNPLEWKRHEACFKFINEAYDET